MQQWQNKVVLVTGAGSGIGKALALQFASMGAKLIITDINQENLDGAQLLIEPQVVICKQGDVSDKHFWLELYEDIQRDIGYVDAVINNAGMSNFDFFEDMPDTLFDKVMAVNFNGVVMGCRHMLPLLLKSQQGMIVNVASVFSLITMPMLTPYHASKFAVRGFTESLRQDMLFSEKNIDVLCVLPGGIKTNIAKHAQSSLDSTQAFVKHFEKMALTTPEKAAKTIIRGMQRRKSRILIGPDARFIHLIVRLFPQSYFRILSPLFGIKRLLKALKKG